MSTSTMFLTKEEIISFLEEYKKDSDYSYGYQNQEFGICPYVTFYLFHSEEEVDDILRKIVDIYEYFENKIIDKPFKLRYKNNPSEWKEAALLKQKKQNLIAMMQQNIFKDLICFIGATSGDSEFQSARWAIDARIRILSSRYTSIKLTFGDKWYRSNQKQWHSFVEKCLEQLKPIQTYSGYEIGNTGQFSYISPEFETVECTFTDYFYGLDIDHPSKMAFHSHNEENYKSDNDLGAGIRTPTWCFLLSPYWLEKLGLNEEQIREKLNDPRIEITKIEDLKNPNEYSLWIRLGELSLYPVEEGVPELLVMANDLIKPIRCDNLKLTTLDAWDDDPNPRFDVISSKQWIARFDEDSTWPELKRVEVEPENEERIDIVAAGEPCPHAGYWYTFAKENSRQYFKQGDIFPDFESDWGEVYWQFDGE